MQARELPGTRHVCIGDRESDILALLVMAGAPLGHIRFEMPAGRGRKARAVEQEVRAQRVLLPYRQGGALEVTCLIASEINAPAGAKPVVWRLLTNRVASTLAAAVELVNWYCARWEIEIYQS